MENFPHTVDACTCLLTAMHVSPPTCNRVKDQVKSRMQALMDEESQSRLPPKERTSFHSSPQAQSRSQSRSTTSSSTRSVGRATQSSVVAGSPGGGDRARHAVGAEADLIFSTSVGEFLLFTLSTCN